MNASGKGKRSETSLRWSRDGKRIMEVHLGGGDDRADDLGPRDFLADAVTGDRSRRKRFLDLEIQTAHEQRQSL